MQAKRFSRAMKAPLIFCSTSHSINVQKIFVIVLSKAFDLRCTIPGTLWLPARSRRRSRSFRLADTPRGAEIVETGEPLLIYVDV